MIADGAFRHRIILVKSHFWILDRQAKIKRRTQPFIKSLAFFPLPPFAEDWKMAFYYVLWIELFHARDS